MCRNAFFVILAVLIAGCGKKDKATDKSDTSVPPAAVKGSPQAAGLGTNTEAGYEQKARETALSFLKSVREKNLEEMLKLSTVPFINEKQPFLETLVQLKAEFQKIIRGIEDPSLVPRDIIRVESLPIARPITNPEDKKLFDLLMTKIGGNGYLVMVGKGKSDDFLVVITKKNGMVLVAGILP